jgi:hypothetical protein
MKRLLKAAAALLCAFGIPAFAQYTTVTAAHIYMGGTLIPSGKVTFAPVSSNGSPISFAQGGGGLNGASFVFTCTITSGAITGGCSVPDSALTTPANILYLIQITNTSVTPNLSFSLQQVAGVTGTTWALDAYGPPAQTSAVQPVQASSGTTVPSSCVMPSIFTKTNAGGSLYYCVNGVFVAASAGAVTASQVQSVITPMTGCNTAGYAWLPQSNTCGPASGGGTQTKTISFGSASGGNATPFGSGWSCNSFSANAPLWVTGGGGSNTSVFAYPEWVAGPSAKQVIQCWSAVPASFGGSYTVDFLGVIGTHASDAVILAADAACPTSTAPFNPTFGTAGTVSLTLPSTVGNTIQQTSGFTVTPSGTCTAGNPIVIEFYRSISDGGTANQYVGAAMAQLTYTGSN